MNKRMNGRRTATDLGRRPHGFRRNGTKPLRGMDGATGMAFSACGWRSGLSRAVMFGDFGGTREHGRESCGFPESFVRWGRAYYHFFFLGGALMRQKNPKKRLGTGEKRTTIGPNAPKPQMAPGLEGPTLRLDFFPRLFFFGLGLRLAASFGCLRFSGP